MHKAIIILTGTPSAKASFDREIIKSCWRWNISAKNFLAETAKTKLYWEAQERDEEYHKKLARFYAIANEMFDFEEKYIQESVERFNQFDADEMSTEINGERKSFKNFFMVIHGISKELTKKLEEEEGAMQVHVTSRALNTNIIHHDIVLYEDDVTFEEQVSQLIDVLTQTQKETI